MTDANEEVIATATVCIAIAMDRLGLEEAEQIELEA